MKKIIRDMWKVLYYGSFISFVVALVLIVFNLEGLYKDFIDATGVVGVGFLVYLLLFKNFYYFNKRGKSMFANFLRYNATCQKEMGLVIFNLFFIHSLFSIYIELGSISVLIYQIAGIIIPLIIFIYLFFTSFKFSQRRVKGWKKSHSIIWIVLPLIVFHAYLTMHEIGLEYIFAIIVLVVSIIVGMIMHKSETRNKKQLIFLMIGIILVVIQAFVMKVVFGSQSQAEAGSVYVTPEVDLYEKLTDVRTNVLNKSNEIATSNKLYADGTYTGSGTGYHGGTTTVSVTTSGDEITDVTVVSNQDTPEYYNRAASTVVQDILDNQSSSVQAVSGCTYTSNGIMEATQSALDQAEADLTATN